MSLKEYEENQKKVKRNNKVKVSKVTVPSLHLSPPQLSPNSLPVEESLSLTSLRPVEETSAIKRQVAPPRPPNPPQNINSIKKESKEPKKTKKKINIEKKPISVPSLHLEPPTLGQVEEPSKEDSQRYKKETSSSKSNSLPTETSSIRATEGILIQPETLSIPHDSALSLENEEKILKTPISFPISRQGAYVGNFPPVKSKFKNPFKRTGAKPPLPPQPYGPPPTSNVKNPALKSSFSSKYIPTKKPVTPFPIKKAVQEKKIIPKAPPPKNVFQKHKRKTNNNILPIPELLFAPEELVQELTAVKKRKTSETNNKFSVNPSTTKYKPAETFGDLVDPEDILTANRPIRNLATYASLPSYSPAPKEENSDETSLSYSPKITSNAVVKTESNVKKYSPKPIKTKKKIPQKQSYSPIPTTSPPKVQSRIVNYSPAAKDVAEDRQGSVGPQIPIISQTQEMNQDASQSFAFDFVTGNGITRSEAGSLQSSGQQQRGQWEYTAPNGEIIKTSFISDGIGGYRPEGNKIFIPVFGPP